jgi:hypothetical protein
MSTWLTQRAWRTWLGGAAIVVGAILVVALIQVIYKAWIFKAFPNDMSTRGQFGDIFGTVTAFFTGLAFAGVVYTIILQRNELENQRKQQTDQSKMQDKQARLLLLSTRLSAMATLADIYTRQIDVMERGKLRGNLWKAEDKIRSLAEEEKQKRPEMGDEEAMERAMNSDAYTSYMDKVARQEAKFDDGSPNPLFRPSFEEWRRYHHRLDHLSSKLDRELKKIEERQGEAP